MRTYSCRNKLLTITIHGHLSLGPSPRSATGAHRNLSLYKFNFSVFYFVELKELEAQRDTFEIPNEESITSYYKIRQQLKRLGNDMLVGNFVC